jgi:hypothetical protein
LLLEQATTLEDIFLPVNWLVQLIIIFISRTDGGLGICLLGWPLQHAIQSWNWSFHKCSAWPGMGELLQVSSPFRSSWSHFLATSLETACLSHCFCSAEPSCLERKPAELTAPPRKEEEWETEDTYNHSDAHKLSWVQPSIHTEQHNFTLGGNQQKSPDLTFLFGRWNTSLTERPRALCDLTNLWQNPGLDPY